MVGRSPLAAPAAVPARDGPSGIRLLVTGGPGARPVPVPAPAATYTRTDVELLRTG
jgi:hypothetical protein